MESLAFPEVLAEMEHPIQKAILVRQVQLDPKENQGTKDRIDLIEKAILVQKAILVREVRLDPKENQGTRDRMDLI